MANGPLVIDIFTDFDKYLYWHEDESVPFSDQLILLWSLLSTCTVF